MFDVSLYGHITLDNIIEKSKHDISVGSIGNVWKALNKIDPELKINLQPTEFGEALILVDKDKSLRASTANLSNFQTIPSIFDSRWHHILYLNELKNIDFITKIDTGIVSVDFCRGKKLKNVNVLKLVDFVLISDEDIFMDLKDMSSIVKKGVLMHHKAGSIYYSKGKKMFENQVDVIENVNVLGCGDMFASCFINNFLKRNDIDDAIKVSHSYVTNVLTEDNDE